MNRFNTLLQREWMQHQRGWMILLGLPLVLVILAGLFTDLGISIEIDGDTVVKHVPSAALQAFGSIAAMAAITLGLAWLSALFQAPGLARRDQQDRSIEFWLSLPTGHVPSLGATLLTHLLLLPWAALAFGAAGGLLVSLLLVGKAWGLAAWFSLPWGSLLIGALVLLLRVAIGILLATLWISPLILITMAASAWLKRWGVPLVAGVIGGGGLVLDKVYGIPMVWEVLRTLVEHGSQALIVADQGGAAGELAIHSDADVLPFIQGLPSWALHDLGQALQALASPAFAGALAVAAAAFMLLVLRRQRGA
ncbi:hypothetical protein [Aquabacterium sp.]|uniref:hypothetical protein n=1 Tax=Aquabacterium sp. TaxID=1872578 RepID=UPI002C1499FF|nr:hypothetical protein [Aquabacterium sp.]HSW09158.1 hypothetical protein [Aquabacterium sp.]